MKTIEELKADCVAAGVALTKATRAYSDARFFYANDNTKDALTEARSVYEDAWDALDAAEGVKP